MKAKNFKQAAQMSLDERWDPIVKAKTCEVMRRIRLKSNCELCTLQKRRHGGVLNAHIAPRKCGRCGLRSGNVFPCCSEFYVWNSACTSHDFPKALKAAQGVVKKLEAIRDAKRL